MYKLISQHYLYSGSIQIETLNIDKLSLKFIENPWAQPGNPLVHYKLSELRTFVYFTHRIHIFSIIQFVMCLVNVIKFVNRYLFLKEIILQSYIYPKKRSIFPFFLFYFIIQIVQTTEQNLLLSMIIQQLATQNLIGPAQRLVFLLNHAFLLYLFLKETILHSKKS